MSLGLRTLGVALLLLTGCAVTRPGSLEKVAPTSSEKHVGTVYLIRGFMGIWSTGMDTIAEDLDGVGVKAEVFASWQWPELANRIVAQYKAAPQPEPIVLIGHSYGADDTLRIAQKLREAGMTVDLVICIDPVTPPQVPTNIRETLDYYQSEGVLDELPWWRGIPLQPESDEVKNLKNMDLRVDRTDLLEPFMGHSSISRNRKLHAAIIQDILAICPLRQTLAGVPTTQAAGISPPSQVQSHVVQTPAGQ